MLQRTQDNKTKKKLKFKFCPFVRPIYLHTHVQTTVRTETINPVTRRKSKDIVISLERPPAQE